MTITMSVGCVCVNIYIHYWKLHQRKERGGGEIMRKLKQLNECNLAFGTCFVHNDR